MCVLIFMFFNICLVNDCEHQMTRGICCVVDAVIFNGIDSKRTHRSMSEMAYIRCVWYIHRIVMWHEWSAELFSMFSIKAAIWLGKPKHLPIIWLNPMAPLQMTSIILYLTIPTVVFSAIKRKAKKKRISNRTNKQKEHQLIALPIKLEYRE